jgi:hypothetical protein
VKTILDIDAYVTGELTGEAADAFEDSMFAEPDHPDLAVLDRIARHGAVLVAHGTWDMGATREQIDKLVADGHSVQIVDIGPPGTGEIAIGRSAEFIVTILPIGTTAHALVDVDITLVAYGVTKTIKDARVQPDGKLYGLCERPLAELAFGNDAIVRVRENHGARTQIAEWQLSGRLLAE